MSSPTLVFCDFDSSHSNWCEVVSHCVCVCVCFKGFIYLRDRAREITEVALFVFFFFFKQAPYDPEIESCMLRLLSQSGAHEFIFVRKLHTVP